MKIIYIFLLFLLPFTTFSQASLESIDVNQLFQSSGEISFIIKGAASQAADIGKIISIDNVRDGDIYAYANKKGLEALKKKYNFQIIILDRQIIDDSHSVLKSSSESAVFNYYPSYTQYLELMNNFKVNYPSLCKIDTIGKLPSGRLLLAARISDNVGIDEDEPEFFYTSSMHGDEVTGYILMLDLIEYLLTNYNTDQIVSNLVNNIDIWINPLANPDGTFAGGNSSVSGARRFNANYIDLNRNYPDPKDGLHPDGELWQPETVFFMNFAEKRDLVMSANLHDGAEVVNYPWDTWERVTADDQWWRMVSREYADKVQQYSSQGYFNDLDNGVTNGYAWYTINGGRQDYMNYYQQTREVTIEISAVKTPPASQLENFWRYHYRSLLGYMNEVLYGVRGIVTDSTSDMPLAAQVTISGHDKDSSMVFSNLPIGNYHRLIKAGTYSITFSAPGYISKTIDGVTVQDKSTRYLDVKLARKTVGIDDNELNQIIVYPNPVTIGELRITSPVLITGYKIYNLLGNEIKKETILSKEFRIETSQLKKGIYMLELITRQGRKTVKIIIGN